MGRRKIKLSVRPCRHQYANMKQKTIRLSRRYGTALQAYLKAGPRASLLPALGLGRQAVATGLETLELARMHEQAVTSLEIPGRTKAMIKRAEKFFTEAIAPIVETHRAARQGKSDLNRLNLTLSRRTQELAATNLQLKRGIQRRQTVETALKLSGDHYADLLKESLQLQSSLRQLTHQVLAAQEQERKTISHELQDEVAQTLLGINVRLLTLKQEAKNNTKGLKQEIATTQRLMTKSAQSVRRVAREFGNI